MSHVRTAISDDFKVLNLIIRILLKNRLYLSGKNYLKNSTAEPATNVQLEINQLLGYCYNSYQINPRN